jgi:rod shape determining protein RodA
MIKKIKRLDYVMIIVLFMLFTTSLTAIYSATHVGAYQGLAGKQAAWIVVTSVLMMAVALTDYRMIAPLHWFLYGLSLVLLLAVFLFGVTLNGAKSWLNLSFFLFQPSELVKILLILFSAQFFSLREGRPLTITGDLLPYLGLVAVPILMVLREPDLGTTMVFMAIAGCMLWIGNIKKVHVLSLLFFGCAGLGSLILMYFYKNDWFSLLIKPHQLERVQTFLDPYHDPLGAGYQVIQSMTAIGSGWLSGTGYLQGSQIQQGFIPYAYSDSIFVVIGEEFGFLGSSALIIMYFVLIYRMVRIAIAAKDLFGSYLISGIIAMLLIQVFENIGMLIGLMPLSGIPLPFISYGGSSLLTNMIAVGLALSVKVHTTTLNFRD